MPKPAATPKPVAKTPGMFEGTQPEPTAPKPAPAPADDVYTSEGLPFRGRGELAEDKLTREHLSAIERRLSQMGDTAGLRAAADRESNPFKAAEIRGRADDADALRAKLQAARERLSDPLREIDPFWVEEFDRLRKFDQKEKTGGRYEAESWKKVKDKNPDESLPPLSRQGAEYVVDLYESDGKQIPEEVFEGHPDLAKKYAKPAGGK